MVSERGECDVETQQVLIKLYFHRVGETPGAVPFSGYLALTERTLKRTLALSLKFLFSTQLLLPQPRMKGTHQQAKCGHAEQVDKTSRVAHRRH